MEHSVSDLKKSKGASYLTPIPIACNLIILTVFPVFTTNASNLTRSLIKPKLNFMKSQINVCLTVQGRQHLKCEEECQKYQMNKLNKSDRQNFEGQNIHQQATHMRHYILTWSRFKRGTLYSVLVHV